MLRWRDLLGRLQPRRATARGEALALIHRFNAAAMQAEETAQALSELPGFSAEGGRSARAFAAAATELAAGLLDAEADLRRAAAPATAGAPGPAQPQGAAA